MITQLVSIGNTTDQQQNFYFICYDVLANFLQSERAASLLQRIHYWLQNKKSGYLLADGTKWIFNGYREWQQQFPLRSVHQIGRDIRYLEKIGWLKSKRFWELKREVGFITPTIHHPDDQRKFYRLDYQKIYEDTGFDLLFNKPAEPPKTPKRAPRAIVQNCTMHSTEVNETSCTSAQSLLINSKSIPNTLSNTAEREENFQPEGNTESELGSGSYQNPKEGLEENSKHKQTQVEKNVPQPPRQVLKRFENVAIASTSKQPWGEEPWVRQDGSIDNNFVTWKAQQFQAEYGGNIYSNRAKVLKHYAKSPVNIAIDWRIYHEETSHHASAILVTEQSGKAVPDQDKEALSKRAIADPGPLPLEYESPSAVKEYSPQMSQALDEKFKKAPAATPSRTIVSDGNMTVAYHDYTGIAASEPKAKPPTQEEVLHRKQAVWKTQILQPSVKKWAEENSDWVVLGDDGPQLRT